MALTKVHNRLIDGAYANVKDYGATGDGTINDVAAFVSALAANDAIYVPAGTYIFDTMLSMGYQKTIFLAQGATLKRASASSSSTDPVVWLNGSFCQIIGCGMEQSQIITENACPDGVVKLGMPSMSDGGTGNVERCRIEGISIKGSTLYGQTSGDPDVCLQMTSPEIAANYTFSYFHVLHNIALHQANIGMHFEGYVNGCFVDTIYGVHLGNTSVSPAAMIYMHGGLDNTVSNVFFNQSNDSDGILIDDLDNTANGTAAVMSPDYNSFTGIVCEQGGTNAYALRTLEGARNYIQILDNTSQGVSLHSTFRSDLNQLVTSASANWADLYVEGVTRTEDNIYVGKDALNIATEGVQLSTTNSSAFTTDNTSGTEIMLYMNLLNNDGTFIDFRQDGTSEGTITVSGTTVALNGAHLTRWSQLEGNAARSDIPRGSVLSNIDEMCVWGDEDNEQLNRMKVSDVEGDINVAGVFQGWDETDTDENPADFYCAQTGDFIIRIGSGVTVNKGDLLISAGDGTAKPQADDIVRSSTIAKVTSNHVSCTYDDGSFCVPCVLMVC